MIPLEDNFADMLGKAMAGLRLSEEEAARKSSLSADKVRSLLNGLFEEEDARRLAAALGLRLCVLFKRPDAALRYGIELGDAHKIKTGISECQQQ